MSTIGHCKRGDMDGIKTTTIEQNQLADLIHNEYIDAFIPLPGMDIHAQSLAMNSPHDCKLEGSRYWENENGSHGWACKVCGKVHQWG